MDVKQKIDSIVEELNKKIFSIIDFDSIVKQNNKSPVRNFKQLTDNIKYYLSELKYNLNNELTIECELIKGIKGKNFYDLPASRRKSSYSPPSIGVTEGYISQNELNAHRIDMAQRTTGLDEAIRIAINNTVGLVGNITQPEPIFQSYSAAAISGHGEFQSTSARRRPKVDASNKKEEAKAILVKIPIEDILEDISNGNMSAYSEQLLIRLIEKYYRISNGIKTDPYSNLGSNAYHYVKSFMLSVDERMSSLDKIKFTGIIQSIANVGLTVRISTYNEARKFFIEEYVIEEIELIDSSKVNLNNFKDIIYNKVMDKISITNFEEMIKKVPLDLFLYDDFVLLLSLKNAEFSYFNANWDKLISLNR